MASVIKFLLCYVVVVWVIVRGLWWLDLIGGAEERSRLLDPDTLKTSQLKDIIEQRGISYDPALTKPALTSLVLRTGGLFKADLETVSDAAFDISKAVKAAKVFEDSSDMNRVLKHEGPSVWLVFCGSIWRFRVLESMAWNRFIQKLMNNGISFAFKESFADCGIILRQQWVSSSTDPLSWRDSHYTGCQKPREVLLWMFRIISYAAMSSPDFAVTDRYLDDVGRSNVGVVIRPFYPTPLSLSVLASEFMERAYFVWENDSRLEETVMLVVFKGEVHTLSGKWFLNQSELRLLLKLLMPRLHEFGVFLLVLYLIGCLAVLIDAEGGKRIRILVRCLIAGFVSFIVFIALAVLFPREFEFVLDLLFACFSELTSLLKWDIVLLTHVISKFPLKFLGFSVFVFIADRLPSLPPADDYGTTPTIDLAYVCSRYGDPGASRTFRRIATRRGRNRVSIRSSGCVNNNTRFNQRAASIATPTRQLTTPMMKISTPTLQKETPSKQMANPTQQRTSLMQQIATPMQQIAASSKQIFTPTQQITTPTKLIATPTQQITTPTQQIATPTQQIATPMQQIATSSQVASDKQSACETSSAKIVSALKPISSPVSNHSSLQDSLTMSDSQAASSDISRSPFEFPALETSEDGFDPETTAQLSKLSIPKSWLRPIVPGSLLQRILKAIRCHEELFNTQASSSSATVCFFCGTDFLPAASRIFRLPCQDACHTTCFDEWSELEEFECPRCQKPIYSTS